MRSVTLKSVIDGVSQLMGQDPATMPDADRAMICEFINQRIVAGWTFDFWPEWTTVERRAFRPAWSAGLTYAAGTELILAANDKYYAANSAPNNPAVGESPLTHPAKWTELTTLVRNIALDQAGLTPIGEVKRVCRNDPRLFPKRPGELLFDITEDGILLADGAPARVYVEFRKLPPVFSLVLWNQAEANAPKDIRYRTTLGDCFECLQANTGQVPEDAPTFWRRVEFPAVLVNFVKRLAYADTLRGDDHNATALAEEGRAYQQLNDAHDRVFASQGQYETARVVTS